MAEFCLECLRKFEPNANEDNTTLSDYLDWCEGCAELRQVVLTFDDEDSSNKSYKVKPRKIETAFCLECGKKVKFKIEWKNRLVCRAYSAAEYKELYAICKECGNEVYVPAINDINVNHSEKAYAELFKTQIQPTPIVTGEAAKRIEKQLKTRSSKDVEKGIEILKKMFLDGGNSNE